MNHKLPGDNEGPVQRILHTRKNHPLPQERKEVDNAGVGRADLKWCTMACEHAEWPRENVDGAKSCRTFNALWCKALGQHVARNAPCAVEHGSRRPKPRW